MSANGHDVEVTAPEGAAATVYLVPISGDEMGNLAATSHLLSLVEPLALALRCDISAYRETVDAVVQRWHAETGRPRSAT
jgi:hypothetical protein